MTERPFDRFWVLWSTVICCGTGKPQTAKNCSMMPQTGLCSGGWNRNDGVWHCAAKGS